MQIGELVSKRRYGFDDLCAIMDILRGENGCPWDKEQTHTSIRKNLIEETYEVAEAIDTGDAGLLCEELGDLLLQVVFHAKMAGEDGRFDIGDVCDGICQKLILRHPHIFKDKKDLSSREVLQNWEEIKRSTKTKRLSALDGVPPSLPALMRAAKTYGKAENAGLYSQSPDFLFEEIQSLSYDLKRFSEDKAKLYGMFGSLLFSVSAAARAFGVDAEEALGKNVDAFSASLREKEQKKKEEK